MKKSLLALISAPLLGSSAFAGLSYNYTYTFNFPAGSPNYTISNLYLLEAAPGGVISGFNLGLRYPGDVLSSPAGGSVTTWFAASSPAQSALLIAETHDLPGDAAGQKHIVLGMANDAASLGANIAWGTLFRNTDEDQLIADLDHFVDPDPNVAQNALQELANFAYGDATSGILDNLAQPHTAWFDPHGTGFSIMSWSNGTLQGAGTVTESVVPEPTSLALIGMGCAAIARKRRRVL